MSNKLSFFIQIGRYVPRAILMDLEPGTMDSVRSGNKFRYKSEIQYVNKTI